MCLAEGDVVIIPELEPYRHTISTDQTHTITVQLPKLVFKLQVRNENGEIPCNKKFELQWPTSALTGTADGNGVIEQEIPSNVDCLASQLAFRVPGLEASQLALPITHN